MFADRWAQWHAGHERRLADPHGFLAVTGLHFLTAEPRRFPDAPGEWSTGPAGVVVDLADGESLTIDGVTRDRPVRVRADRRARRRRRRGR